jgi:hypothetical protein
MRWVVNATPRPLYPRNGLYCISIKYFEFASVALITQHAIQMRSILLSPVACLTLPYFFYYYFINDAIFGKVLLNIKCVLTFSSSEIFLILRRTERDLIKYVY